MEDVWLNNGILQKAAETPQRKGGTLVDKETCFEKPERSPKGSK